MKVNAQRRGHVDLFQPVVGPARRHPSFELVSTSGAHGASRATMGAAFARSTSWDKHFVNEFQGPGFDARVWELYLYETFVAEGLNVRVNGGKGPDFVLHHRGQDIYVEAVTSTASGGSVMRGPGDPRQALLPTDLPTVRQIMG